MDTFNKRQKEMRRLERQKDKEARRILRKQNRANAETGAGLEDAPEAGPPGPETSPAIDPTTDA
jgi:hypothetical protein